MTDTNTAVATEVAVSKAPSKKSLALVIFQAKLAERTQGLFASNKEFRAAVLGTIETELGVTTASAATMYNAAKKDAEAAGAAAFAAALIANLAPRTWRRILDRSLRGRPGAGRIVLRDLAAPSRHLSVSERADAAEAMLRTIGLTTGFAPVLILSPLAK